MPPLWWHQVPGLPPAVATVLSGLAFRDSPAPQRDLDQTQWREALNFCDRSQLTLVFGLRCREQLPPAVRRRIESNFEANTQRIARLKRDYFQIAARLDSLGIEHVLLKGFLQAPRFVPNPQLRVQYDLDLLFGHADVTKAQGVLRELGFHSIAGYMRPTADHLPPMARKTAWRWKGNYFDPQIPTLVELHFRLWNQATERFAVEGIDDFWERRAAQPFGGQQVPALHEVDQFGYAAIHALRHLLRGDLKPFHVYELAYFLENYGSDNEFARAWRDLHPPAARSLQAVPLLLAERWFSCRFPKAFREAAADLPAEVHLWLRDYAAAPVVSRFRPNKDELWLHLSLLSGVADKLRVLRRRLIPLRGPAQVEGVFVPEESMTAELWALKWLRYTGFLLSRASFHARSMVSVFQSGFHWWRQARRNRSHR